ncbi:MAG: peptidase S8 [Coriobacteriaceae bacterium]|nr:peptidase S8 [Coriobacteriaceae bacterium]
MYRPARVLSLVVVAALLLLMIPAAASAEAPSRVIVRFTAPSDESVALAGLRRLGGARLKGLPIIGGAVVELPDPAAARAAARLPGVASVEPDIRIDALAKGGGVRAQPAEVLPWGVRRVGADVVWPANTADPVKVAVVDTGIQPDHPDLVGNVKDGMSAVSYTTKWADDNGHGTHVAGTIAAVDNSIGVIGVAPAADLYAVKVLDRRGSGWLSDIIEGLQWSAVNGMDVVNLSLGTSVYSASFDAAVQNTIDSGVVVVAAAGNSGPGENTVGYPAAFPNVIAVAATDSSDNVAWFSSRGPQVTIAAPGVSVYSTYKGSAYQTLSGTSMASPHVAGAVALTLNTAPGAWDIDSDGWDPAEVRAKLIAGAEDLGPAGFDTAFGYGLVRADR